MERIVGARRLPLSIPRRLVGDLLHFARQVPSVPVQRRMALRPVVEARRNCLERPSWVALFAKAFSLVAAETPPLRQAYLKFPWPHLYEAPFSVATVAIEREYQGEPAVFFAQIRSPDEQSLPALHGHLHRYKSTPLAQVSGFRRALRLGRIWQPLRRLGWWYWLNVSGARRTIRFGTFGISVYSRLGVDSLHPLGPLTSLLNYGPIGADGRVDVRLIYDHRVMDGSTAARALLRLEEVLRGPIVAELNGLAPVKQAAAPKRKLTVRRVPAEEQR
jgi:hypothetical protein